jgi:hypothetical protein
MLAPDSALARAARSRHTLQQISFISVISSMA